jgi:tRNA 2-selenouridine synthase
VIRALEDADRESLATLDTIIDVRSPGEFAEDHMLDAITLPVLTNDERALVGTTYAQNSRFEARRIGAAIVARDIGAHLDGALGAKPSGFAPLVYRWRGGQRSSAMAIVLDQLAWRVATRRTAARSVRNSTTHSCGSCS